MILEQEVSNKKSEYGEYFINLKILSDSKVEDKSLYEESISTRLDEYIFKYGNSLMKLPIETLYNIFNFNKRMLTNEDSAYELIKRTYENTREKDLLILLDTLDMKELNFSHCEETIFEYYSLHKHIPKIDYSFFMNLISNNKILQSQNEQLSSQLNSLKVVNK